ncbi:MAG: alanine--glyoxylate aminotransferase family protein [Actinobacteria bacterium]|nr:alanine--glyoxylate aminotransferase family protein [Actinomycetota bacterium]NIS29405.1 alanine--glyoxylate aminotransferase family protein [Actinomycetota bacterium]NIT94509.1 alanine--glyoxylate aminotransferase family protein [Actinomycetota bacterium]NIU18120.1 alanine--glyoxylate aminotransferase family protein [Actinomycetota bacterium]NIU64763.1 alanine--glyoxylate aminotransferase family protein [Actinomycetota bacterium]
MPGLRPDIDPDGLLEYSVVYTDRARNHMSEGFRDVMTDVSAALRRVYGADAVAIVPGSGTFAMEAVARQFATDAHCLVIRNGWFSYRWTQIFEMGSIPRSHEVCKARPVREGHQAPFMPAPVAEVVATIEATRPAVVFAPHVETASGIILPDDYITEIAAATRQHGGMFVLDCIASGTIWVDMRELGVDVVISAPQKGWSASPFGGLVMLADTAQKRLGETTSTSFSCDLRRWREIMHAYEEGGHAYHATMPTDAIARFRDVIAETDQIGFDRVKAAQQELGDRVRAALATRGYRSVAADGFAAPGVVVSYTDDPEIQSGAKFAAQGLQIAAGVPLMCDEPDDYRTFRLGLFGLDKLLDVDAAVARLEEALDAIG